MRITGHLYLDLCRNLSVWDMAAGVFLRGKERAGDHSHLEGQSAWRIGVRHESRVGAER